MENIKSFKKLVYKKCVHELENLKIYIKIYLQKLVHVHFCKFNTILTQLTTGGKSEADIATPINGPTAPCSKATATPVPEVNAHKTPIHSDLAFPLNK